MNKQQLIAKKRRAEERQAKKQKLKNKITHGEEQFISKYKTKYNDIYDMFDNRNKSMLIDLKKIVDKGDQIDTKHLHNKESIEQLKSLWNIFKDTHSTSLLSETDLKLNFINLIVKHKFGGQQGTLLGCIGGNNILDKNTFMSMDIVKYEFDTDIVLISEILWTKETSFYEISYILSLFDIVELQVGFPCYKRNDIQYDLFKYLGFTESKLKADKGQVIMIKEKSYIE